MMTLRGYTTLMQAPGAIRPRSQGYLAGAPWPGRHRRLEPWTLVRMDSTVAVQAKGLGFWL